MVVELSELTFGNSKLNHWPDNAMTQLVIESIVVKGSEGIVIEYGVAPRPEVCWI